MKNLENTLAIVTGAASLRGIGFASASKLASEGATVVITDIEHTSAELDKRCSEIQSDGGQAEALCFDICDESQINAAIAGIIGSHGKIDVLFNNAGVGFIGHFEDASMQDFDRNYQINVRGTVALTKAVVPHMKDNGGGSIINNASIGGIYADPYYTAYNMSKFAVVGFTKSLALEMGEHNIRVNAICPGFTDTEMADGMPTFFANKTGSSVSEARQACYQMIAMMRPAKTAEIAELVAFLAGKQSSYITGSAIPISGGFPQAL